MRVIKNVFRRKMRAFLTISGITIGVLALVVMGGMAEKINLLVDGGTRYYGDKVIVADATDGGAFAMAPMSTGSIPDVEAVEGVRRASASLAMTLEDGQGGVVGMPALIIGTDLRGRDLESFKITYSEGRALKPGETGAVVIGSDLVKRLGAKVGEKVTVRGEKFEVVGISEKTLSAPDTQVTMSLADAQRLYLQTIPTTMRDAVDADTFATQLAVYPETGVDPDKLAKRIEGEIENVSATGPSAFREQVVAQTQMLSAIVYGIALVSLLVGGLSVINTMTMAVAERTREIGVRKAIGATDGAVMKQFVAESGVIGLVGGLLGLALGTAIVYGLNAAGNASGTDIFLVTSRLALASVAFATVLGIVSGLYPAWHAARLNPVHALRAE